MKKMGEAFDRLLALTSVIPGIIVALLAIGVAAEVFAPTHQDSQTVC